MVISAVIFLKNYYQEINEEKRISVSRESLIKQKRDSLLGQDIASLFKQSLDDGGQWLLNNQLEDGSFCYERSVETGELTQSENNIVRQSGTLYGLAKLYNYTKEGRYRQALIKGFNYFDRISQTKDINGETVRFFKYRGSVQANTVALLSLAYLELAEADGNLPADRENKLKEMANFTRLSQQSSGAFQNYFLDNASIECWESDYNNGESFLALVGMYRYTKDKMYLPVLEKSADYLINKYADLNLKFYSWGAMAFAQLYELTQNNKYREFVYQMTNQLLDDPDLEYEQINNFFAGKTEELPRYSQIVQTEGLLFAYKLAARDNPALERKYRQAIIDSLAFHTVFQSPWEETLPKKVYQKVKGGFCNRSNCRTQRIDMVHHAVSAYVDALRFMDKNKLRLSLTTSPKAMP